MHRPPPRRSVKALSESFVPLIADFINGIGSNTAIVPARPYRARDKAKVYRVGGLVHLARLLLVRRRVEVQVHRHVLFLREAIEHPFE
jgi:hypothetical protein